MQYKKKLFTEESDSIPSGFLGSGKREGVTPQCQAVYAKYLYIPEIKTSWLKWLHYNRHIKLKCTATVFSSIHQMNENCKGLQLENILYVCTLSRPWIIYTLASAQTYLLTPHILVYLTQWKSWCITATQVVWVKHRNWCYHYFHIRSPGWFYCLSK